MISIPRSLALQFRAVARRAGFSVRRAAYVRLMATPAALRLLVADARVAVELRSDGRYVADDLTVPLQLFADCEGKSGDLVTIRPGEAGHLVASWDEEGVPQHRDYLVADETAVPMLPAAPADWTRHDSSFLIALRDGIATTDTGDTRYALDCVQWKGDGSLGATDGKQLLVQMGFPLGGRNDLLVVASDVFASRELSGDHPVEVGATADWMSTHVGDWTIHHAIHKQGRFPDLSRGIPQSATVGTRLQLDPADVEFVSERIGLLPVANDTHRPVTLDMNGSVAIRTRQDATSPVTELVLSRSRREGPQLRITTNREYLLRAIRLGFTDVGFADNASPCVCTDGRRTYAWSVLDPKESVEATADAQRLESVAVVSSTNRIPAPRATTAVARVAETLPQPARESRTVRVARTAQVDRSGGVGRVEPRFSDVIGQSPRRARRVARGGHRPSATRAAHASSTQGIAADEIDPQVAARIETLGGVTTVDDRGAERFRRFIFLSPSAGPSCGRGPSRSLEGLHMPMTVKIGLAKKVGQPDYGSLGAKSRSRTGTRCRSVVQ